MKKFINQIKSIYNKISVFQSENNANGKILTRDQLMEHSMHLLQRWAELEMALNSIANIKVNPKYADIPFHWEVMDELVDYIQKEYPSVYNEACDKIGVFRNEDGEIISYSKFAKLNPEYYNKEK